MTFKDLKEHDILLIKNIAKQRFIDGEYETASTAIIAVTFEFLNAMGMNIVKDDSKVRTWSELKPNLYAIKEDKH